MAAVGAAAAEILDGPFSLAAPTARALPTADAAPARDPDAPVVLCASLPVHGEPCLLLISLAGGKGDGPSAAGAPAAAAIPSTAAAASAPTGVPTDSADGTDAVPAAFEPDGETTLSPTCPPSICRAR